MRPTLRLLSDELIARILDEAYRLLETKGVTLHHDGLLGRLSDLGCRVDWANKRVRFTREIVETSLATVPGRIRLWNIAGTDCCDLSGDRVHFTPGSAAIKMLDSDTGRMRLATRKDMSDYSRLAERLAQIDFVATAVVPSDVPAHIGDSLRLHHLLRNTTKPIVTGAFTVEGFNVMTELQLAVRGSRSALKEKPFAIFSCCPTSPLKWSDVTSDNTARCAELGIPVEFIAMPLSGLVAPISLTGCLIQHAAETISGIVISQSSCPGAPVLYGGSPGTFDMRTLAATIASPEAQMMDCAYAEIGKHLGIPTQAYMGLSDSKFLDAQAGFESGTGLYLAALAGINSVSGPGMMYFESCLSLEKLVLDNELCGMARRLAAGIEPREDFPCDGLFDELLREGNLLAAEHTSKYFRAEHYIPAPVIDRTQVAVHRTGYSTLLERARRLVAEHLDGYLPPDILAADQVRALDDVMQSAAGDFDIAG